MIPKSGNRFPACANPCQTFVLSFDASAGEGRSEKIMLKQKLGSCRRALDCRGSVARSLRLDAGELDHLTPFLGFVGDQLAEVGG
jgi:hypothetical protein